jgi:hypothetical protein
MKKKLFEVSGHVTSSDKHRTRRGISSRQIPTLLGFGAFLLLAVKVQGDFIGSYALTPPGPGSYRVSVQAPQQFGGSNWTCQATTMLGITVDTTSAPTNLVLYTDGVTRGVGGSFYARAAAAGTVSFQYTITGESIGSFSWFNNGPNGPNPSTFLMSVSNLVAEPTAASFHVEAGDYFGFHLRAEGSQFPPQLAQRLVTIQNFVAPEALVGLPTISIHNVIVAEPTNGTATAVFTVTLSAAHTQAVTVAYSTTNATATAGSDYQAASGTMTFNPGETNKAINVTVLTDSVPEGNEDFRVVLSDPTNATLALSQGTCTINELRITSLAFHVDVSFNTVNQARYRVEWTEDTNNWTPVPGAEDVPGTGSSVTITHTNAACNPGRVYRVLLLQ